MSKLDDFNNEINKNLPKDARINLIDNRIEESNPISKYDIENNYTPKRKGGKKVKINWNKYKDASKPKTKSWDAEMDPIYDEDVLEEIERRHKPSLAITILTFVLKLVILLGIAIIGFIIFYKLKTSHIV